MTPELVALVVYGAQLAVVVLATEAALQLTRPTSPSLRLRLWRAAWLLAWLLPFGNLLAPVPAAPAWLVSMGPAASRPAQVTEAGWLGLLVPVVVMGAGAHLAWLAVGLVRLRRLRRRSEPAMLDATQSSMVQAVAPHADVRWTDDVAQPVTFGNARPVVLLPRRLSQLDSESQLTVLCHELLHVRRRDWRWILLERATGALLWCHPAAWWLLGRLHLNREQAVDDAVVQRTGARRAYMEALMWFAGAPMPRVPAPAFIGRRHLHARLSHLAQERTMTRSRLVWTVAATLLLVGGLTTTIVMAVPLDLSKFSKPRRVVGPQLRRAPWAPLVEWALGSQSNQRHGRVYSSKEKGITLPSVVSEVKPSYTPAALEAKIAGDVLLAVVVKADGTVGDVAVAQSLDKTYGLDQAAFNAARLWKFKPGTREGTPVDVQVDLQMRFTLK